MSSNVNKPTGGGYQGSPWRVCTICGHRERAHYGHACHVTGCTCKGFCAREDPEVVEARIEKELEVVGEVLYRELKDEERRRYGK